MQACLEAYYSTQNLESWRLGTIAANQFNVASGKRAKRLSWEDFFPRMGLRPQRKKAMDLEDMRLYAMAQISTHYRK